MLPATESDDLAVEVAVEEAEAAENLRDLMIELVRVLGPQQFVEPVEAGFLSLPTWISKKFRLTLWCEHSRLPLPFLNPKGDKSGVYEFDVKRDWLVTVAPYLKVVATTLSLVLPAASAVARLQIDDTAYKAVEKSLEDGKKAAESLLKGGEKLADAIMEADPPDLEAGDRIRASGASLRRLHAFLKEKDPGFGGLVRVLNKRQEFLWVHRNFEREY